MRYAVDQGAKGIVVQAVGMGNMNVSMFEAVKYALSKSVPVVISTCVHTWPHVPAVWVPGWWQDYFRGGCRDGGRFEPAEGAVAAYADAAPGEGSKAEFER